MTFDEAKQAARLGLPITCNGVTYLCISMIGIKYINGNEVPFVQLMDKNQNSYTDVSVSDCRTLFSEEDD
jgi:hypothetical protein